MARHCAPCRAQRAPWRAQGAHLGAPWRAMTRQRAHHGEPWRAMSRPKSIMARQGAPCRAQRAVGALVGTFGAAEGGGGEPGLRNAKPHAEFFYSGSFPQTNGADRQIGKDFLEKYPLNHFR
jgi:hypothetical protein